MFQDLGHFTESNINPCVDQLPIAYKVTKV